MVLESLALLFRIREILGSNLGPETGNADWDISWFSAPPGTNQDSNLHQA